MQNPHGSSEALSSPEELTLGKIIVVHWLVDGQRLSSTHTVVSAPVRDAQGEWWVRLRRRGDEFVDDYELTHLGILPFARDDGPVWTRTYTTAG